MIISYCLLRLTILVMAVSQVERKMNRKHYIMLGMVKNIASLFFTYLVSSPSSPRFGLSGQRLQPFLIMVLERRQLINNKVIFHDQNHK